MSDMSIQQRAQIRSLARQAALEKLAILHPQAFSDLLRETTNEQRRLEAARTRRARETALVRGQNPPVGVSDRPCRAVGEQDARQARYVAPEPVQLRLDDALATAHGG